MIKIKPSLSCLQERIGLRGTCDDQDYNLYLNDLPNINLTNITRLIDGQDYKPSLIVDKLHRLTSKQIVIDLKGFLAENFTVKKLIQDSSVKTSGNHEWYGEVNEFLRVRIEGYSSDKFVTKKAFGFGINVDRDVVGKKFYIESDDHERLEVIVDLKKGYNKIPLDIETQSENAYILFDVSNFKIGRKEHYYRHSSSCGCFRSCNKCEIDDGHCVFLSCQTSPDGCIWTEASDYFGFDLCVQCVCNPDAIMCYFADELELPYLYKMGINFLLEAKSSTNVNAYTTNSEEQIDNLLLIWNGGIDPRTAQYVNSEYWRYIKSAAATIASAIHELNSQCFCCSTSYISNQLP